MTGQGGADATYTKGCIVAGWLWVPPLTFVHLFQYIDALNNIWRYYEVYLNQAKQLNADTVRELANSYASLKVHSFLYSFM